MKSVLIVVISLSLLPMAFASDAGKNGSAGTTGPPDLRGIYVDGNALPISKEDSTALVAAMNVPGVDGFVLVLGWKNIEPAKGKYAWTSLDQWMNIAISTGKKVELSIRADFHTPSWLFQPPPGGGGATPLSFSFPPNPGDITCLSETIAAPWDPAFLEQWDSMLDSLSTHLKSSGTYSAVVILRLTGINRNSDELHLPSTSSGPACATNNVATWQLAGYRPSLLLKGWDSTTSSFKRYFPDKCFSVAIIAVTHPFPAIAEDGTVITGTVPNQNLPLLTLASEKFPGHLVIQNNSLYPGEPAELETIQSAQSLKTMIAFQTNEDISGKGAACGGRGDTTHCTDSTYLAELQRGIYPLGQNDSLRAQYIEVFALNVNALPDVVLRAHNELFNVSSTGVKPTPLAYPVQAELAQNYPNPFNPNTVIHYSVSGNTEHGAASEDVNLVVYDLLGREVAVLVNERKNAGSYDVKFDASGLPSGVYLYRLQAGNFVQTRKLLLIR